jgi:hypothetical protein
MNNQERIRNIVFQTKKFLERNENENKILHENKNFFSFKKKIFDLCEEIEILNEKKKKLNDITILFDFALNLFEKYDKKEQKYYIYNLKNKNGGYLFLSLYKIDDVNDLINNIKKYKNKNTHGNEMELIIELNLSSMIHGEIILDKIIYEKDMIKNGNHDDYNIVKKEFMYKEPEIYKKFIDDLLEAEISEKYEYDLEYFSMNKTSIYSLMNQIYYKKIYSILKKKYSYFPVFFSDEKDLNYIYYSHNIINDSLKKSKIGNSTKSKYYYALSAYFADIKNVRMSYHYNSLATYYDLLFNEDFTNEEILDIDNNKECFDNIIIENLPEKYSFTKYYNIFPELTEKQKNMCENVDLSMKDKFKTFYDATRFDKEDKGYIYIILNEKTWRNIPDQYFTFKVGRTTNLVSRISSYVNGKSKFLKKMFSIYCERNLQIIEIEIKREFKKKFQCETFLMGNEYFTGCIYEAQKIIIEIVSKHGNYELQKDLVNNLWLGKKIDDYYKFNYCNHLILVNKTNDLDKYKKIEERDKEKKNVGAICDIESKEIDNFINNTIENIKDKNIQTEEKKEAKCKNNVLQNKKEETKESNISSEKNDKKKENNEKTYKMEWYEKHKNSVAEYNRNNYLKKKEVLLEKAKENYHKKSKKT